MTDIEIAKGTIDGHSVCFCKDGKSFTLDGMGLSPLMRMINEGKDLHGYSAADVVVGKVTECDSRTTGSRHREVRRGVNFVSKASAGFPCLKGRLPEILAVLVLEFAKSSHTLVIGEECGILAVRTLEGVDEVDNLICGYLGFGCGNNTDLCATVGGKQTEGLTDTRAVDECILLGIGECLTELLEDVAFKIEGIVIKCHFFDMILFIFS